MANQMIALGARAPQVNVLGGAIQQGAQMINMMRQQEAAARQAAVAEQQMGIERAREERAAALAKPQLAEAEQKALSAQMKAASDFLDLSIEGMKMARGPEDAVKIGDWLKTQFRDPVFQEAVDQTLSSLPQDPSQFGSWREQTLFQSMDAKDQLSREFQRQTTGREERIISMPKYGAGTAVEVPGSRIQAAEDITYVRGPSGEIIPMPKTVPGTGGLVGGAPGLVGGERGGSPVKIALQTNPGALKDSPFTRSQPGYAGASGGFATFNSPEAGIAAQENLLRSAYVNKGFNTIDKIVNRYAPQGPENSAASVKNYKGYIAQRTGIDINAPISAAQIPAVAAAMREFETGNRPGGRPAAGGIQMGQPLPGTDIELRQVESKARSTAAAAGKRYDRMIKSAEDLLKSPQLDTVIGNVQGNVPETALSLSSQGAANALALYNTLVVRGGFAELQNLREASLTGGALGQVTDRENVMLQQAAATLSRTQDEATFRQRLSDYINELKASKQRVEQAWERDFGRPFSAGSRPLVGGASAPAPQRETQRGSNIDDLLKKYGG